uniref:Ig-like domain-containing protein n=1 Tax=Coturnix japonica TaxID=93934 RepID=A0A8C2TGH7_COTJA
LPFALELLLTSLVGTQQAPLVVVPKEPVVQYGDAVQLNCSLPCPGGTVQWKGLDTNLGSIDTFLTHSILKISSAKLATAGTKICLGTCGDSSYQETAQLQVYCKHPHPFTWGLSLQRGIHTVTEQPMATSTESPHTTVTTTVTHSITVPAASTLPSPEPQEPSTALNAASQRPKTPTEWAAASKPTLPEHHQGPALSTASLHLDRTTATVSTAATQGLAMDDSSPGSHITTPTCSLQIWSLPPNGTRGRALRIGCQAHCAHNASVHWLHTPVALSQYREEAVGSGSTLWLDRAEPHHQGYYQCILLGRHAQAVSMELVVSDGE